MWQGLHARQLSRQSLQLEVTAQAEPIDSVRLAADAAAHACCPLVRRVTGLSLLRIRTGDAVCMMTVMSVVVAVDVVVVMEAAAGDEGGREDGRGLVVRIHEGRDVEAALLGEG